MPNESPQFNVLLRSEQSNGEVATIEIVLPAGSAGPPLHHHDFDEAFYVLDGELTFQLGEELATAGPGTLTFAPRGSHHTLANLSAADARYLLVCTPAGFERYFARMADEPPEWALQEIPFTVERVGPQIGRS
jgi:mannose-6-phosphate isomerase-like protein (cupin superfamily)